MYSIATSPHQQLLDELGTKLVFSFSNIFSHYIKEIKKQINIM